MPAAVNHLKKTKKTRSPPASPFSSPLASPPATDPGFPRLQIRDARGGRREAVGRAPASLEKPAGHADATAGPPPPRQSLAGDHADASSRIPVPPCGSRRAVVEGGRRANASSPAVVEVPTLWPWWIPASWPWWRSTAGSGRSTARSTEEEGAAARSVGEEVAAAGSMEEEVAVAGSRERKREK